LLYTAGGCMKLLDLLFAQPTDSISIVNVWFVGYMVYGKYLQNYSAVLLWRCNTFEKNEFSLTQPQLAASCYLHNLLPIFWQSEEDHFALFVPGVLIYFRDL